MEPSRLGDRTPLGSVARFVATDFEEETERGRPISEVSKQFDDGMRFDQSRARIA